jgi:hypothetical protein
MWTPAKAIQSFEKKPIFIFRSIRVPGRGSDNNCLLRQKNALAESVFAVPLFKGPTMLSLQTNQEAETVKPKNGRKTIAFRPVAAFSIAQHNYTRLGPKRHQLFILFDGEYTHRGDGLWSTFLAKRPVFSQMIFQKVPISSIPPFSSITDPDIFNLKH